MSGRHRSSVDGQLTQQNISKFVNINKTNKDNGVEKNVIFQGILESEYEDIKDIKTSVEKAIVSTMTGESEEERKTNAGQTSIETVERMGKYNPMRTRPVKVKFSEKRMLMTYSKTERNYPKESILIRNIVNPPKRNAIYLDP